MLTVDGDMLTGMPRQPASSLAATNPALGQGAALALLCGCRRHGPRPSKLPQIAARHRTRGDVPRGTNPEGLGEPWPLPVGSQSTTSQHPINIQPTSSQHPVNIQSTSGVLMGKPFKMNTKVASSAPPFQETNCIYMQGVPLL